MKNDFENPIRNQKGQSFIEFIFLMVILVGVAFTFMGGMRSFIGYRWEAMVKIIATPNGGEVSIP